MWPVERAWEKELKEFQNYLCSSVSQDRVCGFSISVENYIASKLEYTDFIAEFDGKKAKKVSFTPFFHCMVSPSHLGCNIPTFCIVLPPSMGYELCFVSVMTIGLS